MGICASCLGLNRHPSQENRETDPLLDDSISSQYGGVGNSDCTQLDGEELRREREALDLITAEAAEYVMLHGRMLWQKADSDSNMIDRSRPGSAESNHHMAHTNHDRYISTEDQTIAGPQDATGSEDAEEAAWLQSIQSAGLDPVTEIKGLQSGPLVMDIGQLRQDPPSSSAKKTRPSREKP
ncbi:hypothetical protein LTR08_004654 [Meristemomyces frigidus]|nr:hypothetical protein LTR08_004654 [Meristemomyces frigidus]